MAASPVKSLPGPLSFDTLAFISLSGLYVVTYRWDPKSIMLASLVVLYLCLDVFWPWEVLPASGRAFKWVFLGKQAMLLFAVALVTFVPAIVYVAERRVTGSLERTKDSVVQIEAGLDFMRQGQSPYGQDYSQTDMIHVAPPVDGVENPALRHVIYLPFFFELSYPFYRAALALWGWWDERLLYMALLAICLGLLAQIPSQPGHKLAFLPLLGLSTVLVEFPFGGNDIFPLTWVAFSALLLFRGRKTWAGIMLALAAASKQTTWFLVPFFLAHLLGPWPWRREAAARAARAAWPMAAVFALSCAPFLLADPAAFLSDTLGFILGLSSFPVYITGSGFGQMLLALGVVETFGRYPFWLWQLGVGLPLMVGLIVQQVRRPDARRIWLYGACLGLVVNFFGRVFFDSYMGFYFVVALLGGLADPGGQ